jgi:hypothetical protein
LFSQHDAFEAIVLWRNSGVFLWPVPILFCWVQTLWICQHWDVLWYYGCESAKFMPLPIGHIPLHSLAARWNPQF